MKFVKRRSCFLFNFLNLAPTTIGETLYELSSDIKNQTSFAEKDFSCSIGVKISLSQKSDIDVKGGHLKQNPPLLISVT